MPQHVSLYTLLSSSSWQSHAPAACQRRPSQLTASMVIPGACLTCVCVFMQDEVEIVHQEGDEGVRQADVEDKIIRQVDQLVDYFNSLFHDDQLDIRSGVGGGSHASNVPSSACRPSQQRRSSGRSACMPLIRPGSIVL